MSSVSIPLHQLSFLDLCPITTAVDVLASSGGTDERGAIFTRGEVVCFILDLCGYTQDKPLHQLRLLEPSFGGGDFLLPAVDRLMKSWLAMEHRGDPLIDLGPCIRAVELHQTTYAGTLAALIPKLEAAGLPPNTAAALADHWLSNSDFLLTNLSGTFDLVVGNPPYVRQELIPAVLMAEYRKRYVTIYDRADLYIPFIERSLGLLREGGVLGFICADRWMKNRYGGPLRELIAKGYHLRAYVDMTETAAFHSEVIAYPAVTIIGREKPGATRTAIRPAISAEVLSRLALKITSPELQPGDQEVRELVCVTSGNEPWILDSSAQMKLLRRLEDEFPTMEEAGCKVGIGVATGADKAFIGKFAELDVEDDRKVPLVTTRDIVTGRVVWRGLGVINPFRDGPGSGLVNLDHFPRLRRYLESHKSEIARRHVAQKNPAAWYRTIDRITESLTHRPKLLIPDIKGDAQIVLEEGRLYPHHNLYFVTSNTWDLQTLQAVLLSRIAKLFVASYSTKMRGGFLRFQAQYLRRIRVPMWENVPIDLRGELREAASHLDVEACNRAVFKLYRITDAEADHFRGDGG